MVSVVKLSGRYACNTLIAHTSHMFSPPTKEILADSAAPCLVGLSDFHNSHGASFVQHGDICRMHAVKTVLLDSRASFVNILYLVFRTITRGRELKSVDEPDGK